MNGVFVQCNVFVKKRVISISSACLENSTIPLYTYNLDFISEKVMGPVIEVVIPLSSRRHCVT